MSNILWWCRWAPAYVRHPLWQRQPSHKIGSLINHHINNDTIDSYHSYNLTWNQPGSLIDFNTFNAWFSVSYNPIIQLRAPSRNGSVLLLDTRRHRRRSRGQRWTTDCRRETGQGPSRKGAALHGWRVCQGCRHSTTKGWEAIRAYWYQSSVYRVNWYAFSIHLQIFCLPWHLIESCW